MLPYLAAAFVLLLVLIIFYGLGIVFRAPRSPQQLSIEKCSLCRNEFDKSELIEREVGDSRVYYFCSSCVHSLASELERSAQQPTSRTSS